MTECPFLSSYDDKVECFADCALFNYKDNNGLCPFKSLEAYNIEKMEYYDSALDDIDLKFIKSSYLERKNEYL